MADNNQIPAYPFMFDQSQWSNKYSPFAGKAIPFPAQYRGTPTDALGRPIQSYLDTQAQHDAWRPTPAAPVTLNSNPNSNPNPNWAIQNAMLNSMGQKASQVTTPGGASNDPQTASNVIAMRGMLGPDPNSNNTGQTGSIIPGHPIGAQQAQPAAAPQTNPYDMNQAYLDALANPGKVTTPGATVPQSAPPSNQSGVLQQFLQNWKPGINPAGNYNPNLFPDALRGMV